jgi:hypothetical protein
MRKLLVLLLCLCTALLAAGGTWWWSTRAPQLPGGPVVLERVREVSRLQTLEVTLFKKVSFSPEPQATGTLWKDVVAWAAYSVREPHGRAILFADATLSIDLSRLGPGQIRVVGSDVELVLPPVGVQVALRPADTEILDSNLDSAETAKLFELAQEAFLREVERDEALKARARESAERTLRALMLGLGYRQVRFVDSLPPSLGAG